MFLVKQADGSFELTVPLPTHNDEILYKYIVDGQWKVSPTEKVVKDESGIENNYVDANDLFVSHDAGSKIPESGGMFVAGNQSKKGDLNTTVMPSTEGKHATVAGEPGIQIPQDKDSLAAFTKFENPNEKGLNTAAVPSTEGQQASIAGEPGIQIPQDKDSLDAFTKFENTNDNADASELSPEEKKKQKKKVKRSQYKAKKKKKAAEAAGAFGAGGATAGGFSNASKGVPEGVEGTDGTEGNDITTTEGETEPEATPEPQTLDPQARDVQDETKKDKNEDEIIAAAGLSGVGAGVGAAAAADYSPVDNKETSKLSSTSSNYDAGDKDTGAVALGDVPAKSNADVPSGPSGLDSQPSESKNEFLPVVGAPAASQGTNLSGSQAGDKVPTDVSETSSESSKDNKHGALGGAALGGAALGGGALAGGAAASHFAGNEKSDLPEYAGDASHFADEKKSSFAPGQFSNKESELPKYGGSDSRFVDDKKQGDAALGGPAIADVSSRDNAAAPQTDSKLANEPSEPKAAETSKAEKYGAPALGGAALAGTGYAAASSGPEKETAQAISDDIPIHEQNVSSTLDPKAKETAPLNKETAPSNKDAAPISKETAPLNKETQPNAGGIINDANAEKEVDASPVTGREGVPPLTQFASADEIVIAQGAGNNTNVEAELRAREHGDVIVEEIQPTESEKQRLTEEAHLYGTSNEKSTSEVKPNNSSNAASAASAAPVAGAAGTTAGTSSKKPTPAKKDAKKEVKKDAKKDAKKDEKKKKGLFSKLKNVFK